MIVFSGVCISYDFFTTPESKMLDLLKIISKQEYDSAIEKKY